MSRKMRDPLTDRYMSAKRHAVMAVEMYKGWMIVRVPGGPGSSIDFPNFQGILKSRSMSRPGVVTTVETMTQPSIALVRREINKFQESEYGETERKVIVHG